MTETENKIKEMEERIRTITNELSSISREGWMLTEKLDKLKNRLLGLREDREAEKIKEKSKS